MHYKMIQKFNTYLVPPIEVVCMVCDPDRGKDWAKKIVALGYDNLLNLSLKCICKRIGDQL